MLTKLTPSQDDAGCFREATGMVMHKDSRWYQSWQTFKDNNQIVTSKSLIMLDITIYLVENKLPLTEYNGSTNCKNHISRSDCW